MTEVNLFPFDTETLEGTGRFQGTWGGSWERLCLDRSYPQKTEDPVAPEGTWA